MSPLLQQLLPGRGHRRENDEETDSTGYSEAESSLRHAEEHLRAVEENRSDSGDEDSTSLPKDRAGGTSWQATAAVLLADMFGLGTLTLPGDFANLGWAVGLLVTLASAAGLMFSGILFTRLSLLVPRAKTFADFGEAAYGRRGRRLVYIFVYTVIALEPVMMQLTCTEALRQIAGHYGISRLYAGLITAAVMLPLSQIQSLQRVSSLAYVGTVGMLLAVATVFGKLVAMPARNHMKAVVLSDPRVALVAVMDIVFTYGGQVNWVRYMASMRRRADFVKSTSFTGVFMTGIYVVLGLYGYYVLDHGFDTSQPVTSIFPYDKWVMVMNAGVLVHTLIAYQITLNVWVDMMLNLSTRDLDTSEERQSARGRQYWAAISTLGVIYSLTVSQVVPYFSLVMAIIAAIGDLTAAYVLPAAFALKLSRHDVRLPMPRWQQVVCYVLIPASAALSAAGLGSSVWNLAEKVVDRFH